jgi:hypothetical protein
MSDVILVNLLLWYHARERPFNLKGGGVCFFSKKIFWFPMLVKKIFWFRSRWQGATPEATWYHSSKSTIAAPDITWYNSSKTTGATSNVTCYHNSKSTRDTFDVTLYHSSKLTRSTSDIAWFQDSKITTGYVFYLSCCPNKKFWTKQKTITPLAVKWSVPYVRRNLCRLDTVVSCFVRRRLCESEYFFRKKASPPPLQVKWPFPSMIPQ